MTKSAAREALRARLADDQASSLLGDSRCTAELVRLYRRGFPGYDRMPDAELIQCAVDAGLAETEGIAELVAVLRRS